jgi:hypothetical protein
MCFPRNPVLIANQTFALHNVETSTEQEEAAALDVECSPPSKESRYESSSLSFIIT